MNRQLLEELAGSLAGTVRTQVPLASLNTFGVGGAAAVLVEPACAADIASTLKVAARARIPLYVLGAGSNIIVPDEGVDGLVLRLADSLGGISLEDGTITAEAGATDEGLSEFALERCITGFEWCYDIPGSVGGAVYMNAGNADGEIADSCLWVDFITPEGESARLEKDALAFSYRSSIFQHDVKGIIWRAGLAATRTTQADEIRQKMDDIRNLRRCKFPEETLCAGSIFKRPPGHFAGKLIEDAGCGGMRVGGALVSPKHKGFIVNTRGATATDVLTLIAMVQERVQEDSGIPLKTEVESFAPFLP